MPIDPKTQKTISPIQAPPPKLAEAEQPLPDTIKQKLINKYNPGDDQLIVEQSVEGTQYNTSQLKNKISTTTVSQPLLSNVQ